MSALASLTLLLCCTVVGASILSMLAPQKRTRRIFGFVIGLFVLVTLINGVKSAVSELHIDVSEITSGGALDDSEEDYRDAVVSRTADILVRSLDELLRAEGVVADDIRLKLKTSDSGSIYADRIDIYISEQYRGRRNDIRSLVYTNLSKEPGIYVKGQEVERAADG